MSIGGQPKCYSCKHHIINADCEAFPEGIPGEIFSNLVDHTRPYPGDNGIRYEKWDSVKPGKPDTKSRGKRPGEV